MYFIIFNCLHCEGLPHDCVCSRNSQGKETTSSSIVHDAGSSLRGEFNPMKIRNGKCEFNIICLSSFCISCRIFDLKIKINGLKAFYFFHSL